MGILDNMGGGNFQMGLLGLAGLGSLFENRGPRYTTNIAEATTPRENNFMNALPAQMALIARQEQERKRNDLLTQMQQEQIAEKRRQQEARARFAASLPPNMDPAQRAFAEVNPDKVYESQFGGVLSAPALAQKRMLSAEDRAAAMDQWRQQQVLPQEAVDQKIKMQQAGQVLPDAAVQQRIAIANQSREPRMLSPEEEAQQIRMAQAKAAASAEGKAPSEGERKASGFYDRMVAAEKVLKDAADNGYDGRGFGAGAANALGAIPLTGGVIGNLARGEQNARIRQAQLDWAGAKLRFESGATISDQEIAQEAQRYFPQPGEGDEVVKQKAEARARANEAMRKNAGRAAPEPVAPSPDAEAEKIRDDFKKARITRDEAKRRLKALGYD